MRVGRCVTVVCEGRLVCEGGLVCESRPVCEGRLVCEEGAISAFYCGDQEIMKRLI